MYEMLKTLTIELENKLIGTLNRDGSYGDEEKRADAVLSDGTPNYSRRGAKAFDVVT